MEEPYITTADVTQQIFLKSAGPNGIKPDLLKILGNDTHRINILGSMNKIIQKENNIPASWYTSKTVLIIIKNSKRSTTNSTNKCNVQIYSL